MSGMVARSVRSTILPGKDEHDDLESLARALRAKNPASKSLKLMAARKEVPLPTSMLEVLARAASELARGNGITVLPVAAELTTEEAAELLNVSRPFVVKLTDSGALACHKVGTHRRIHLRDVLAYKRKYQARARAALAELVDEAQELGIYEK
jgi:excisionase family DNA binding protein